MNMDSPSDSPSLGSQVLASTDHQDCARSNNDNGNASNNRRSTSMTREDSAVRISQEMEAVIANDLNDLRRWATIPFRSPFRFRLFNMGIIPNMWCRADLFHFAIGGAETIALKIQAARIDVDGDGKISSDELKAAEERFGKMVGESLNLLTNTGVVGALIVSVLYAVALAPISAHPDTLQWLGDVGVQRVTHAYNICLYAALVLALVTIYSSVAMFIHLSFHLAPDVRELQVWYVRTISLAPVVVRTLLAILFSGLALPFGVLLSSGPIPGMIMAAGFVYMACEAVNIEGIRCTVLHKTHEYCRVRFLRGKP
jgi:hypothetical protein